MAQRIGALIAIFLCSALAWIILGATIFERTNGAGNDLRSRVISTWGAPQEQAPPIATVTSTVEKMTVQMREGKETKLTVQEKVLRPLAIERSRIAVDFDLVHRKKGLLWYATYGVRFLGDYRFRNSTDEDVVTFTLPFPADQAIYDDVVLILNGTPRTTKSSGSTISATVMIPPGSVADLRVGYRSQGLSTWYYRFDSTATQVRDFELTMNTNFKKIDVPAATLSPTTKRPHGKGWELTWQFRNLVTGYKIGMVMPEKLQPGPLAGRISFFAPVSLLFFFFLIFIITTMRGIDLHPMNYFFLAAAFFAFHLLIAYLVDHISIHLAFAIASVVSIFLVVTYLRLVVGLGFALREAAGAQLVYLVLFSYAFFFEGFTGLAVTIGAIITLFVVMQMTGRIKWSQSPVPVDHALPAQ